MLPTELLATAPIPGQTGELKLYRHDRDYMFRVRGIELMTSRVHGSEEMLAELALDRIQDSSATRALVGGLGMGFTLATLLTLVGADAKVEVVELIPEVVDWNREWLGELTGHPLRDPRVEIRTADVAKRIRAGKGNYDVILLDVDNGPEGLTRDANDWLYTRKGLIAARKALTPNGILAVWSSTPHDWFTARLLKAGFKVDEQRVRARRTKGARHSIWLATRPEKG